MRTYLLHKRRHILQVDAAPSLDDHSGRARRGRRGGSRDHRHDRVAACSWKPALPVDAAQWRGSRALERFRPDLIECQDAYNLPWVADRASQAPPRYRAGRRLHDRFSDGLCRTAVLEDSLARPIAGAACADMLCLLRRALPALRCGFRAQREWRGNEARESSASATVDVVPLGVEIGEFGPARRDPRLRAKLGLADNQPLLIYVGRLDGEKKPDVVVDAFRQLPRELGAKLVLLGEGPLKAEIEALRRRADRHAGLRAESRRTRPLAGERRHLRLRHGRRDVRRLDRRGAGVRSARSSASQQVR